MADYEGMFQDRYTRALSAFADAAAQGKDPRELLTEMQANPTYGQATGRGNLPEHRGTGPIDPMTGVSPRARPQGAGSMTDREIMEFQGDFPSGSFEDMRSKALRSMGYDSMMEFQSDMQDAAAGGGINTLISTPNELLLNLGRKLTGE